MTKNRIILNTRVLPQQQINICYIGYIGIQFFTNIAFTGNTSKEIRILALRQQQLQLIANITEILALDEILLMKSQNISFQYCATLQNDVVTIFRTNICHIDKIQPMQTILLKYCYQDVFKLFLEQLFQTRNLNHKTNQSHILTG